MTSNLIDGKAIAAKVRSDVAADVAMLKSQHGLVPGLAVVLVGEDAGAITPVPGSPPGAAGGICAAASGEIGAP